MIFGRPGSGKSVFAVELSKKLNLPLYHLDQWFFNKDWSKRDREEFLNIQQEIVNKNEWISC